MYKSHDLAQSLAFKETYFTSPLSPALMFSLLKREAVSVGKRANQESARK